MTRFIGSRNDVTWSEFRYPVTRTQKETLNGVWYLLSGTPNPQGNEMPRGGFYSQRPDTGAVIVGLDHRSVTVHRTGRITVNRV
jgi:hypothetical protein